MEIRNVLVISFFTKMPLLHSPNKSMISVKVAVALHPGEQGTLRLPRVRIPGENRNSSTKKTADY